MTSGERIVISSTLCNIGAVDKTVVDIGHAFVNAQLKMKHLLCHGSVCTLTYFIPVNNNIFF